MLGGRALWEVILTYTEQAGRKLPRVFRKQKHVLWDVNRAPQSNSLGKFWIEQGETDFFPAGFLRTLNMLKCTGLQDKVICAAFPKRAADSFINLTAR